MGFFDKLLGSGSDSVSSGLVNGPNKKDGGHNHSYNTGKDQTPAQKAGHVTASKTKAEKNK